MNKLIYFLGVQVFDLPSINNKTIIENIIKTKSFEGDYRKQGYNEGPEGGRDVETDKLILMGKANHQSQPELMISNNSVSCQEFEKLITSTSKILNKFFSAEIEDDWLHIVPPQKRTIIHDHGIINLSFCYYLNSPEDCGDFKFVHNSPNYNFNYNFKPRVGELFVFPSYLKHETEINKSKQSRYTYAGNAKSKLYSPRQKFELINERYII